MEIFVVALVFLAVFSWIISGGFQRQDKSKPGSSPRKKEEWTFIRENDGSSARVHITDGCYPADLAQARKLWAVCGSKLESPNGFSVVDRPDYETVCLRCLKLDNSETKRLFENIKGTPSPLS
jgi:hypothetical protein